MGGFRISQAWANEKRNRPAHSGTYPRVQLHDRQVSKQTKGGGWERNPTAQPQAAASSACNSNTSAARPPMALLFCHLRLQTLAADLQTAHVARRRSSHQFASNKSPRFQRCSDRADSPLHPCKRLVTEHSCAHTSHLAHQTQPAAIVLKSMFVPEQPAPSDQAIQAGWNLLADGHSQAIVCEMQPTVQCTSGATD